MNPTDATLQQGEFYMQKYLRIFNCGNIWKSKLIGSLPLMQLLNCVSSTSDPSFPSVSCSQHTSGKQNMPLSVFPWPFHQGPHSSQGAPAPAHCCSPCRDLPISQWFGSEGALNTSHSIPCHRQGQLPLSQVAPNPIQPSFGHFQGLGSCRFSVLGVVTPNSPIPTRTGDRETSSPKEKLNFPLPVLWHSQESTPRHNK